MLSKAARQSLETRFGVEDQSNKKFWSNNAEPKTVTPKVIRNHKFKKVLSRRGNKDHASMKGADDMKNSL
jgi:hypothetical protein